jgi:hypothetical protein
MVHRQISALGTIHDAASSTLGSILPNALHCMLLSMLPSTLSKRSQVHSKGVLKHAPNCIGCILPACKTIRSQVHSRIRSQVHSQLHTMAHSASQLLTREEDEEEEEELSVDPNRRGSYGLIYERERRKTPCRLPKPKPNAEYQCRALLLAMGAGEAHGGRKPLASCPGPPASNTREATGPNP